MPVSDHVTWRREKGMDCVISRPALSLDSFAICLMHLFGIFARLVLLSARTSVQHLRARPLRSFFTNLLAGHDHDVRWRSMGRDNLVWLAAATFLAQTISQPRELERLYALAKHQSDHRVTAAALHCW